MRKIIPAKSRPKFGPSVTFLLAQNPVGSIVFSLLLRLVLAVGKKWTSPADCIKFWATDHNDDRSDKLLLLDKMALWCFKCSPPQV